MSLVDEFNKQKELLIGACCDAVESRKASFENDGNSFWHHVVSCLNKYFRLSEDMRCLFVLWLCFAIEACNRS